MATRVSINFHPTRFVGAITVQASPSATLPTTRGPFRTTAFREAPSGAEHLALVAGDLIAPDLPPPLVRLHSCCVTGDVLRSRKCDCGEQKEAALDRIAAEGRGIFLYLGGHEGRGIGLYNKIAAYAQQDGGADTVQANLALGLPVDARDYRAAIVILQMLRIRALRLLTNNPDKVEVLSTAGFVVQREPLIVPPNPHSAAYLATKSVELGHQLDLPGLADVAESAD